MRFKPEELKSALEFLRFTIRDGTATWRQIAAVLEGMGLASSGIWMIYAPVVDPEPTSKLGFLIAGGIVLSVTGSVGLLAGLWYRFQVRIKSDAGHLFEICNEKMAP